MAGEDLRLGTVLLAVCASGELALALVWNIANRRHLLRLQQALQGERYYLQREAGPTL